MNKKRSIIDYTSITPDLMQALLAQYPYGFEDKTIKFKNAKQEWITAIPLETESISYLVKVGSRLTQHLDAFVNEDTTDDDIETSEVNFDEAESSND